MGDSLHFDVIMADPPWPYDSPRALVGNGGRGSDGGRAAAIIQADVSQHYEVMTVEQIKTLPVAAAAAKNSLLFLWTTNPFLADGTAVEVVRAWGFTPKNVLTWAKVQTDGETPSMKTGHWFRSASEHIIFGVRGSVRRPEGFEAMPTWRPAKRLPHSQKPDLFYEIVEKTVPGGRFLEMFARREARNAQWSVWGNEVASTFQLIGT
jgi:N6-adenosine-specific RNA methylase IME4